MLELRRSDGNRRVEQVTKLHCASSGGGGTTGAKTTKWKLRLTDALSLRGAVYKDGYKTESERVALSLYSIPRYYRMLPVYHIFYVLYMMFATIATHFTVNVSYSIDEIYVS